MHQILRKYFPRFPQTFLEPQTSHLEIRTLNRDSSTYFKQVYILKMVDLYIVQKKHNEKSLNKYSKTKYENYFNFKEIKKKISCHF